MDTASLEFLVFGLFMALLSNLSHSRTWRTAVLLVASLIFIAVLCPDLKMLAPLTLFLLAGYGALLLLEMGWTKAKMWFILGVVIVYICLKRYAFLPNSMLLHFSYFTLGLSYIFFRVLQLLIDTEKNGRKHVTPIQYLTYMLNFTTLVSGPIQSYETFSADQFALEPIELGAGVVFLQLERIVRGFFKVNVLAMLLHLVQVDAEMQLGAPLPSSLKIFAAFKLATVYPFFLYTNFSGYIDIVIAIARLMRVRLPENFNRPLSASSFLDFWNRWHITLSNWFKTYVYNPLLVAIMRRTESKAIEPWLGVACFFVTFFLVGVWHGRTSEFLVYGLLQGGGISINKIWQIELTKALGRKGYKNLAANTVYVSFGRGLTFSWFALTLFWFWAGWKEINQIYTAISVMQWVKVWLAVWLVATLVLAGWEILRNALLSIKTKDGPMLLSRYARVIYASALGLVAMVMSAILNQPAPDIVYKTF